ncbi:hypothetical protein Tco_0968157 [Tanacetum coccineum]
MSVQSSLEDFHTGHPPKSNPWRFPNTPVQTRSSLKKINKNSLKLMLLKVSEALEMKAGLKTMQEEWNKKDEKGVVVGTKQGLVDQGNAKTVLFISQGKYVAENPEEIHDVGSCLMYLTASRLDIMYAVCACYFPSCSRFHVTPWCPYLYARQRISSSSREPIGKPKLGLWYPRESPLDLVAYSDSDYAAANLDRKSTTGGCQFLGRRLISWQCKKQTIVATSTTEAEYVAAASCCGQVLWLQNQLLDYGFNFMNTIIHIDNQSTICIIKNPVYHSKTKHIEIRHHFIRDCYEKKLIQVQKIHTDLNVADLLTKAFDGPRYYLELERMLQAQLGHEKGHASCHLLIGCKLVDSWPANPTADKNEGQKLEKFLSLRQKRKRRKNEDYRGCRGSQDQEVPSQKDKGNDLLPEKCKDSDLREHKPLLGSKIYKRKPTSYNKLLFQGLMILKKPATERPINSAERPINTANTTVNTGSTPSAQVNTGSIPSVQVNTGETEKVQRRKGKDPMTEEDL